MQLCCSECIVLHNIYVTLYQPQKDLAALQSVSFTDQTNHLHL
jgi:hypothetical protein